MIAHWLTFYVLNDTAAVVLYGCFS